MKGTILINAYTQSESELYQPRRLQEEFDALGVETDIVRNVCFEAAENCAFCVYLDKDKYAARRLEKAGMRLFNRAEAIEICDDKMLTYIALNGFPMPETMAAPLCYSFDEPVSAALLHRVEAAFGFPVVVKECFGSLGKGVYKVENAAQLQEICTRLKAKPHLFQRYVSSSFGKDVRVVVVGGNVLCAMKRVSRGDFRSNVAAGGAGEPVVLGADAVSLCECIAARLKLDYCGIDLLYGENGFLVCEVNSNAFFMATERVTGVNVAGAYAKHILKQVSAR